MSDQEKHKICAQSGKSLSSSSGNGNKFALIDVEQKHFDSIKKFNDPTGYLNITSELNNNSILSPSAEGSGFAFKMDSKRKSNDANKQPTAPGTATNLATSESASNNDKLQSGGLQIPTYTSIFATNRSTSPTNTYQQQAHKSSSNSNGNNRSPLKKQVAADLELSAASVDRLSGRKYTPINFSGNKDHHNHQSSSIDDEDDDNEGDEIDEKLPFNANSMKKLRSSQNYRRVPLDPRSCPYASKHAILALEHNHSADSPHTRISFNDSRPPSFNTCQYGYDHEVMATQKLDWLANQAILAKCDLDHKVNHKKTNKSLANHHSHYATEHYDRKYTRTKSINLMLKTIVLTLLTILLLMLFVGIILASHYLPQAIDRVLSATRSFNVTIAG